MTAETCTHQTLPARRTNCCLLERWQLPLLSILALCCVPGWAQQERPDYTELPTLESMELPSVEILMQADLAGNAFDWIVLKNNNMVIVANPVYPRPDTVARREEERRQLNASRPTTPEERERRTARLEELRALVVTLPGDAVTEYRLPMNQIDRVIFFEELALRRVDLLLQEGEIRRAYDLIMMVEREIPDWELTRPRFDQLLLKESEIRAEASDIYAALALLDELAVRNIEHPELPGRFGAIVDKMIDEAVQQEDYRRARFLIGRIERHFPRHPVSQNRRNQIAAIAAETLEQAIRLAQMKDSAGAAELARKSESIRASTGNARVSYSQLVSRYQVLHIAVNSFFGDVSAFPAAVDAERRHLELVQVPLFEAFSVDELTYFRSSFFEKWEPTDLGREVLLTLRSTRPHWQSQPVLTANQIADSLAQRLDPQDLQFDSRLASFIREFSVRSPTELKLRFARVPLSLESLLRFPVTGFPLTTDSDDVAAADIADGGHLLSTRFALFSADDTRRVYRRTIPEPEGLDNTQYHIAEIVERKFTDRHQAIQALLRGDVHMLPHVLPSEIDAFLAAPSLTAVKQALPISHVITFNPFSKTVPSAQLRRALSFAIDRESILRDVVLRDPQMKHGRTSSAPWRLASYATNPLEKAPKFDIRLAYALRFAAERQLQIAELQKLEAEAREQAKADGEKFNGEEFRQNTNVDYIQLPPLRMVVEPDEVAWHAAERIAVYWKKIGLDVQLIDGARGGEPLHDDDWDLMYRRVRMEEPLLDLWSLLTNDPSLDVRRLEAFPDWMRQELIGLDYAGSFVDAQSRLFTIHRHIAAQAFLIPLWETDDYVVFQKTVSGYPKRPLSVYQNVERWMVRP